MLSNYFFIKFLFCIKELFDNNAHKIDLFENKSCIKDSDCQIREHSDIHSLFCVENSCKKLQPPGFPCQIPSDCSSYPFYGPLACSAICSIENECSIKLPFKEETNYCCRQIPENKECTSDRPILLNGCNGTSQCLMNEKSEFVCTSENKNMWMLGVFLSIFGNLCINVGINLQKLSFRNEFLEFVGIQISTFYFGVLVYSLGKVSGFSSYIFGKQSLLTSIGGIGLIMNSIFAPLINQEIFTYKDFLAIIFVLTGSSVILMSSNKSGKVFSLCELMKMYQTRKAVIWFSLLLSLLLFLFLLVKFVEVNSEWNFPDDSFNFLRSNVFFEQTDFMLRYVLAFLYISISGIIASFTTLFAKSFGEMVEMTINGDNQFLYGITYLFFLLIIFNTFGQIYWLWRALRHYDALLCIPLFYVCWTLFSNINAGIYFKDFEHFTKSQFKGFLIGWVLILVGTGFLASRNRSNEVGMGETDISSQLY